MGILDPLRRQPQQVEQRYSWQDYLHDVMTFQGNQYLTGVASSRPDYPDKGFDGIIERVHKNTGVVSAAVHQRALLVSQIEPKWKRNSDGELFGTRSLRPLEYPAGGDTVQQFFYRLEVDASYSGSAYVVRDEQGVRRLRPDKCSVVLGSNADPTWDNETSMSVPYDAEVIALLYWADSSGGSAQVFMPGDFAIWSPEPDPINFWRGLSWVTSVVREVVADGQATDHQTRFFENAGTPNLVFIMDPDKTPEETKEFAAITNKIHAGAGNAYKNMYLGGGTDVKVVGSTLESLSLKDITGGFENRVAIRSRIPAVILGTREGLSGSSLNAGNYNSARRMLADGWYAPHADGLMACLERLMTPPSGAKLSWNRESVLFLQEDVEQSANILSTKSAVIRTLIDGGFDPESVVEAISKGKLNELVHSGKLSVQLQPPDQGTLTESPDTDSDEDSEGNSDDSD